jgi:septal ring factor EnvC (AmiA/AmiB activator)|tara:strand:- start:2928 stop:3557 length:630 start_codon:yes stop_codon:yes gene_type:complete
MAIKISASKEEQSRVNKNSSGLFLGVIFVLLLCGILALSLWVSEMSRSSNQINERVESRLSILEEQLQLADSTSTEFLSDINTQLQFLDKEIRKLWDLSNKRNKVNITKLTQDISKQSKLLKDIAITQTNDQKNIQNIDAHLKKLDQAAKNLNQLNQSNTITAAKLVELNKNLLLLEETVQAFDSYRRQNNELMQELQLQVSSMNTVNQ